MDKGKNPGNSLVENDVTASSMNFLTKKSLEKLKRASLGLSELH